MKILSPTTVVILLLCSTSLFAQKREREALRKGNGQYKKEQFTESEINYRRALEVNPNSPQGIYNLGNALYKQNKNKEAAEQFKLAASEASISPKQRAAALHNLGNALFNEKQYDKSVEAYKESLRTNPSDDETRYNLQLAQKMLKQQQQQQQQDKDKKDDKKDDKKEDQKKDNKENKDNQQPKEEPKQQQPPQQQMSKENAEQILEAQQQNEKATQEKVNEEKMKQMQKRRTDKEW